MEWRWGWVCWFVPLRLSPAAIGAAERTSERWRRRRRRRGWEWQIPVWLFGRVHTIMDD